MTDTLVGAGGTADRSARAAKAASAFRTISEVADELDVAQHVLRFWESKFPQVRPLKRGGGRRYYRPEDIDLLRRIRSLLYDEGYTIKGVQKLLRVRRRSNAGDNIPPAIEPSPQAMPAARPPGALHPPEPTPLFPSAGDEGTKLPDGGEPADPDAAARRRALAELHTELLALARLADRIADHLKPTLSEPEDGAIEPPERSVAQPG